MDAMTATVHRMAINSRNFIYFSSNSGTALFI